MESRVSPDVPRETQTVSVPPARVETYREWATSGTGLTAAARVTDSDGRIALVKNGWSDGWIAPGGAVELDETPAEAARREVYEETGLEATIDDPILVVDQIYVAESEPDVRFRAEFVLFDASADGPIPDADQLGVDRDEIAAARWFEALPEDLHDDDLFRPYL
ncbi:NUDIX hydrolase [Natronobacterium gregoryi]|uniref:ADP-ribose pyrophosphatase n=2 Tax=Natronobacterium gregoryi TaxID=44930 RepID=L0AFP8_NATGS|nr:NUDIX hydrolase [Natronobacterium gregoryi]AFZ71977.1 ADP-ribose pyrophosphatase [Natronobacterium gregoryi SP2]ELY62659.1 NUDIX hydrolase [Natronobacterium gregoryi SP2]PLK20832.1 NUDIX hydrolase [Natronobacterium gregoryi SP2]SFJ19364.1 ADP-ribose pyrophosphatase YjhB, NUDIX family [Natronobacterium gregoryi]